MLKLRHFDKEKEDFSGSVKYTLGTKVLRAFRVHVQLLSLCFAHADMTCIQSCGNALAHKPISGSHTHTHR